MIRYSTEGEAKQVRLDGLDEGVLIDRKLSVVTTPKQKLQAQRQSEALNQNGMRAVWEVPTKAEAARARRMFESLGIKNIEPRVVKREGGS